MDKTKQEIGTSMRLISLDALRGITIAAMILVNFPGNGDAVYAPLEHAEWNGITPTDLIFPFFLFIVGVSIALAFTRRLGSGLPLGDVYKKLFFRALKIYALGLFLNLLPSFNFAEVRFAGVLPRIAVVYLVCGLLFLKSDWKTQAITGLVLLAGYWIVMTMIPTPGYGKVMLEPGRNLAAWIDSRFLPGKMWRGTWDPEGILSTFPSFVTCISGMLAGKFLLSKRTWDQKVSYLFMAGFISTVLGSVWSWSFPLNKNLWTSSFVLFTSGLALMTLAGMILAIDVSGYKKWAGFAIIFGSNAIAIYVLADLLYAFFYIIRIGGSSLNMHFFNFFQNSTGADPRLISLLYSLLYVGINFIPAFILYRKKIFIKL